MTGPGTGLPALVVAVSAVLWGLWWIPLRWLDGHGLTGDWASFAIFGLSTLLLIPFVWPRRLGLSGQAKALAMIAVPLGLALVMWNHAVINGNIVRVVLLFYLSPVWATLMARFLLGVPIPASRWSAIVLGLAGAAAILELDALISSALATAFSLADAMAVLSGVCFAAAATATRMHGQVGGLDKCFVSMLVATVVALLFALVAAPPPASGDLWTAVAVAAAVALVFLLPTTFLLLWGATHLDPGRVAILLLLEVVAAAVSSAVLTAEPFGVRELLGCALILSAGLLEAAPDFRRARP